MPVAHSTRELSQRVEVESHRHSNRFRRLTWWTALVSTLAAVAWLGFAAVQGEHRIYQAGSLSTPHKLIENSCSTCHTTWGPVQRFMSLDDHVHSIDEDKCQSCHAGSLHFPNQKSRDHHCADCHREHQGDQELVLVANRLCVQCHTDLRTIDSAAAFASNIRGFDRGDGHPEFAVHRLGEADPKDTGIHVRHKVRTLMGHFVRSNEKQPRWQDKAVVRFNHAKHLFAEYDTDDKLVKGLLDKNRKPIDLSRNCQKCHEPDDERRYMRPINYERHCAECHPLVFDITRFRGETVPHETPEIVRGFLTEFYTNFVLRDQRNHEQNAAIELDSPPRRIPGRPQRELLATEQIETRDAAVRRAELLIRDHVHPVFGRGGCRFCHDAVENDDRTGWNIVPPQIPIRWMHHARFRHEPHRLMTCTVCHADVQTSTSTGDVLLPKIDVCRRCHAEARPQTMGSISMSFMGARTNCVECHTYHDHAGESLDGKLDVNLQILE